MGFRRSQKGKGNALIRFWRGNGQRILTGHEVVVVFSRREPCQIPLVAFGVVILRPREKNLISLMNGLARGYIYLLLHVAEEAFLRGVVSAVSSTGHGLPRRAVLHELNKPHAGIMSALVAVDQRLRIERNAVLSNKIIDRIQNEIYLQQITELPCGVIS